nr:endoribonuclease L-PSP [uncultured bacterium]AMP56466.1 endoribonuclease L-PSP [uncultured bacterium]
MNRTATPPRSAPTASCSYQGKWAAWKTVPPQQGLKAQVRQAFENLNAILTEAGCSFDDVVDVTVFMVDPASTFEEIWEVVPEYWGDAPHPTLTAVGVTWLYGYDFEIKVIASLTA